MLVITKRYQAKLGDTANLKYGMIYEKYSYKLFFHNKIPIYDHSRRFLAMV